MLKTKRRRAVVLALIAFFCTAAATYVAVDWKRFGGGILAFFKGHHDEHLATTGSGAARSGATHSSDLPEAPRHAGLTQLAAARPHGARRIAGGGGGKSGDDLFVYGDPAAGIPAGSFLVAQNDIPPIGDVGVGTPAPAPGGAPEAGGSPGAAGGDGGGGGGPSSSSGGGTGGDNGFPTGSPTPAPAPAPTPSSPPPAPAPPVSPPPAPAPSQSGSTDGPPPSPPPAPAPSPSGPIDDTPPPPAPSPSGPIDDTPPPPPPAPTSAIPEASNVAMMTLGALFLAVAAQRKRSNKSR